MIERINFWEIPLFWHYVAYIVLPLCAVVMLIRFYMRICLWWKVGRTERRWDHLLARLGRLIKYAIAQVKLLRQTYPGLMHVAIAWAFFVFFFGTALATIDADIFKFLRGPIYLAFKLMLDTFTVVALTGIAMAAYRRFVQKPARLTLTRSFAWTLVLLFIIVLTGLLTESLRLAAIAQEPTLQPGWNSALAWWTPVGWVTAQLWLAVGLTPEVISTVHLWIWVLHASLVGFVVVTLPVGTLVHILTSPLNIFFSKLEQPIGKLVPAFQTAEGVAGVATLKDFTWKQLMDADACTECGRCQDACPAYAAGTPLSPKQVMLDIKNAMVVNKSALLAISGKNGGQAPTFTGEVITDATIWACTTCGACRAECPVLIEHVDAIVDMRRYLLARQHADNQLMAALSNLQRYGNSFGMSDRQRALWTRDMQPHIKDIRREAAHTLWYVGDYASYSPALTSITQTTARVFNQVGLDYGLLYDSERNAGNDLRRVGEEGLFELLTMKNKAILDKCNFKEIVTTDPHTYNTLKNEYGLDRPVYHYTEVLDRLITSGRLLIRRQLGYTVTYHDPCYLGRYNGVFDAPRRVLAAIGCKVIEMPRNRDRSLCCGAGGGRIWMQETGIKERPSENRIHEAVGVDGAQYFVVACPKDVTMYRDAVKTAGQEGKIEVKDIIELVEAAMGGNVPSNPNLPGGRQ
jgi:Fe-S oxidoreductase/nitrate reductase gamma subunit